MSLISTETAVPINITDMTFFIDANLQNTPRGVQFRELLRNSIEADPQKDKKGNLVEAKRLIRAQQTEDGKFSIINSGTGMDYDELRAMTNLAASTKTMGLSGRENRGEGAKIASLAFNRLGMRIRSKRDGLIHEVVIFHDEEVGWARLRQEVEDEEGNASLEDVYLVEEEVGENGLTEAEVKRYAAFPGDWTEVVLLGNYENQNTVLDPYGDGVEGQKQGIPNELFARFYDFPDIGLPISVQFHGDSFRGGAEWRPLLPVKRIVEKYPQDFEHLNDRFVKLPTGVVIEFLKTKSDDKSRTPYNTRSMGRNGNRAALVWQGEMYDVIENDDSQKRKEWSRLAPSLGLWGLADTLSVFVHIPSEWEITDGRYRDVLQLNGRKLGIRDFTDDIINARPQWVKDLLAKPPENDSGKSIEAVLKRLAARMSVKRDRLGSNVISINGGIGTGTTGSAPSGKHTGTGKSPENTGTGHGGSAPGNGKGTTGEKKGRKKAPASPGSGSSERKTVPSPIWVIDPESKAEDNPQLIGRGADFRRSTLEYYLNQKYPTYQAILDTLFEDYLRKDSPSLVRDAELEKHMRREIEFYIGVKVGTAILKALHKRTEDKWGDAAVTSALSSEALSIIYDLVLEEDLGRISQAIKKGDFFAQKKAESEGGADPVAATA